MSVAYTSVLRTVGIIAAAVAPLLAIPHASAEKPGWLARTSGEFEVNNETDPRGSIETVQPLIQSHDKTYTLFVQGRAAYREEDWTTNAGLGFRYLSPSRMWMFGVNGWYDRSYDEDHERWGVGGELFGPLLTARANLYDATSGTKIVSETATQRVEERAVDGYDFELEGPIPYFPWARLGVTYFEWDTKWIDDIDGFSLNLKMDLTGHTRLQLGYLNDDVDEIVSASLRIRFGVPEQIEYTAARQFRADTAFVPRTVDKHTLDRVERHHGIVVERRTVNKATGAVNGGVTVGRGT